MAKKSAKSKGYRKSTAKKPYLSKRDIIILCAILAVLIVGAILLFSYDDGALKTKDGVILDKGENWLVVNGSRTSGGRRYFKVGEVGEIDGYDRAVSAISSDANLSQFTFTPADEESAVRSVTVVASPAEAARLAPAYAQMTASIEGSEVSEVAEAEANGRGYSYYTTTYAYAAEEADDAEAEAPEAAETADTEATETAETADAEATEATGDEASEDAEPNRFEQAINAYMDAPKLGSVAVSVVLDADSEADYLDDAALTALVEMAYAAVTFEE